MVAPLKHPFFGNQHTNGGYVKGSYTYAGAVVEPVVDAVKSVVKPAATRIADALRPPATPVANGAASSALIGSLVTTGVVVVIAGGALAYAYLSNRTNKPELGTTEAEDTANFGTCEACGEPLGQSGPMAMERDDAGEFVVCEYCGHSNYARSSGEEEVSE